MYLECTPEFDDCGPDDVEGPYCLFHKPNKSEEEAERFYEEIKKRGKIEKYEDEDGKEKKRLVLEERQFWRSFVFPEIPENIDSSLFFSGSVFEEGVNLCESKFKEKAFFKNTVFKEDVKFRKAEFDRIAVFEKAEFEGSADFFASFKELATFRGARFGGVVYFGEAVFEKNANFQATDFEKEAEFNRTVFEENANFEGDKIGLQPLDRRKKFEDKASFRGAEFQGIANFSGRKFKEKADFKGVKFQDDAIFVASEFKLAIFKRDEFEGEADFGLATFEEKANFGGSKFEEKADFGGVTFEESANFRTCKFKENGYFFKLALGKNSILNFSQAIFEKRGQFKLDYINYANFEGSELRKVKFINVLLSKLNLHDAILEDAYISSANWGNDEKWTCREEKEIGSSEKCGVCGTVIINPSQNCEVCGTNLEGNKKERDKTREEQYKRAENVYRSLKESLEREGNKEKADEMFVKEMRMKRQRKKESNSLIKKLSAYLEKPLVDGTCEYGTNVPRILGLSALIILSFTFIYWLGSVFSIFFLSEAEIIYHNGYSISTVSFSGFLKSLYYSVITFSTLGYGDMHPTGFLMGISALQSLYGALITALIIVVFARKWMR